MCMSSLPVLKKTTWELYKLRFISFFYAKATRPLPEMKGQTSSEDEQNV